MSGFLYSIQDHPELFEFHDSTFIFVKLDGNDLVVSAFSLNLHKEAEQNPKGYDLEIEKAQITFFGVSDWYYDPGRVWTRDENGNDIPVSPEIIFKGEEAREKIIDELKSEADIYSHEIFENGGYEIFGCGTEPYFQIKFKAQSMLVEWDNYSGPAWYEERGCHEQTIRLTTPEGEIAAKSQVWTDYDSEALFAADSARDIDAEKVSAGVEINGVWYWGFGKENTGSEAYADLQKNLPEGIFLKCCLSCRHGNQCIYGNMPDELFCTRDRVITQKQDLRDDDHSLYIQERKRRYADCCQDWEAQDDHYYTYSDYPYFLKSARP